MTTKPTSDREFEAMMMSLDTYLASRIVLPHQRRQTEWGRAVIQNPEGHKVELLEVS